VNKITWNVLRVSGTCLGYEDGASVSLGTDAVLGVGEVESVVARYESCGVFAGLLSSWCR